MEEVGVVFGDLQGRGGRGDPSDPLAGRVWRRSGVWMGVGAPRGRTAGGTCVCTYIDGCMYVLWASFLHRWGGGRGGLGMESVEGYYIHVSTLIERPGSRHWVVG